MPNHTTQIMQVEGNAEDIAALLTMFEVQEPGNVVGEVAVDEDSGKSYYFDFNKIIPMPESLDVESGSTSIWGLEIFSNSDRQIGCKGDWVSAQAAKLSALLLSQGVTTYGDLSKLVLGETQPDWWHSADEGQRERIAGIVRTGKVCMDNIEKYGHPTWYTWAVEHWGTKWNSYSNSIPNIEPTSFTFEYLTAWSPPTPVLARLFEMFPRLSFTVDYIDEGYRFAGTMTSDEGTLEDDSVDGSQMHAFANEKFGWEP